MSEKEFNPNEEVLPIDVDESVQLNGTPPEEDLPEDGDPAHPNPIKP